MTRFSQLSLAILMIFLHSCDDTNPTNYSHTPLVNPLDGALAGNPDGNCSIPVEAQLEDISKADQIVGEGTPSSCTAKAFQDAVAKGGVITFNCGKDPHTIILDKPAKVVNDANAQVVIDGEGLITLSGGGKTRILYMNTCDSEQHWTTNHCQNQDHPKLSLQNINFIDGDSRNEKEFDGGGAVWIRGGRVKIINSNFYNNRCHDEGPDVGGAALRITSQYENLPVYIVHSTFGGKEGYGNTCSNGGAISSINVSWTILNSLFSYNHAIGNGANPAKAGTPGGGSGGAIYNDGNTMTLSVCGTKIEYNEVNAHGSAIFFVSNDHSGNVRIEDSEITSNNGGSWYKLPGISTHSDTPIDTLRSIIK